MIIIKKTYNTLLIFIIIFNIEITGQHNLSQYEGYSVGSNYITLAGSNISGEYVARETITLVPGFSYTTDNTSETFKAYIDRSITLYGSSEYDETSVIIDGSDIEPYNLDRNLDVGLIKGDFNVTNSGGASYQIPIDIPSGINGLQPTLSLIYNSQGRNGTIGYGCNLNGISTIKRVPSNIYSDGVNDGVDFEPENTNSNNDQFAIDGQRLYRAAVTTGKLSKFYRQNASYNDFFIYDHKNNYFKQELSNGTTIYYGLSNKNRQLVNNDTEKIVEWYISKVEDIHGNYIIYNYEKNDVYNDIFIKSIEYGSNSSQSTELDYKIEFLYTYAHYIKINREWRYFAGVKSTSRLLLDKIVISSNNEILNNYTLKYITYASSGFFKQGDERNKRNYLHSITKSDGNGNTLNPITFNWSSLPNDIGIQTDYDMTYCVRELSSDFGLSDGELEGLEMQIVNRHTNYGRTFVISDLNGDGKNELISYPTIHPNATFRSVHKMYVYNLNGNFSKTEYSLPTEYNNILPADFDGDGKTELLFYSGEIEETKNLSTGYGGTGLIKNDIKIQNFNDGAFSDLHVDFLDQSANSSYAIDDGDYQILCGDIDGDGRMDLVFGNKTTHYVFLATINASTSETITYTEIAKYTGNKDASYSIGDYNGDKSGDLIIVNNYNIAIASYDASQNNFLTPIEVAPNGNPEYNTYVSDINGDGYIDFHNKYQYLSKGVLSNAFKAERHSPTINIYDLNRDGITDKLKFTLTGESQNQPTNYKAIKISFEDYNENLEVAHSSYLRILQTLSADFDGDGLLDLFVNYAGNRNHTIKPNGGGVVVHPLQRQYRFEVIMNNSNNAPLVISNFTDGYGNTTDINYSFLTSSDVCTINENIATFATYPLRVFRAPFAVVKDFSTSNGIGSSNTIKYHYTNPVFHSKGAGFLGYQLLERTDEEAGIITSITNEYETNFYTVSKSITTQKDIASSNINSETQTEYGIDNISNQGLKKYFHYYPILSKIKNIRGQETTTSYSGYEHYTHGNPKLIKTYNNSGSSNVTSTFKSYGNKGFYRPDKISKTITIGSKISKSSTTINEYEGDNQIVKRKTNIQFKENSTTDSKSIESSYTYDKYGNILSKTIAPEASDARTISNTYLNGKFIETTVDAGGNIKKFTYNISKGLLLSEEDVANNLVTQHSYGAFNRLTSTKYPDGSISATTINFLDKNTGPSNAIYKINSTLTGRGVVTSYCDAFGRSVRDKTEYFNNKNIVVDRVFNSLGQLDSESEPYTEGTTDIDWHYSVYENGTGRIKSTYRNSNEQKLEYSYSGNKETVTQNNKIYSKTFDSFGNIKSASDPGGSIDYAYYASGKIENITAPGGYVSEMQYDAYGNQTNLKDPDAGTMSYISNGFGELTSQTDAEGNIYTMNYDELSRIQNSECSDGNRVDYIYDTEFYGLLTSVTHNNGHSISYKYDELGRAKTKTTTVDDIEYSVNTSYNTSGDLAKIEYSSDGPVINYEYDDIGTLIKIKEKNTILWELGSINTKGQLTSYTLGNNLYNVTMQYDASGSLISKEIPSKYHMAYEFNTEKGQLNNREDKLKGLKESFTYDNLNQLLTWQVGSNPINSITYFNDGTSRIQKKTGIGIYKYETPKLHAVSNLAIIPSIGNTLQESRNISYTAFNSVETITDNNHEYVLSYGTDNQRVKSELFSGTAADGTPKETRLYIDGSYEIAINHETNTTRHLYYISAGDDIILYEVINGISTIYYIIQDYQSTPLMALDNSGNTIEEYNYDPWGRQRDPLSWIYKTTITKPTVGIRGYTGHEHITEFSLINMNGRVYDPLLSSMLSPDNFVQNASSTINYNRYAYCYNNPLIYTDPGGEFIWMPVIIGAVIGGIMNGMQAEINGGNFLDGAWKGAIVGAVGGALGQFGGGTFLNNVLWGAGTGAITGGLSASLNDGDIGQSMLYGAAIGGVFALGQSTYQSIINHNDYGMFGTNDGVFNRMANDAFTVNTATGAYTVDPTKAQDALDFWQAKNGGPSLSFATGQIKGTTDLYGNINIGEGAFVGGHRAVREQISHEMGHYINNVNWDEEVVGGKVSNPSFKNLNGQYGGDGVFGYHGAIKDAGKYHTGLKMISKNTYYRPNTLWHITNPHRSTAWQNYGGQKWFSLIPHRF